MKRSIARKMEKSVRMEPMGSALPESYEYMFDLAKGFAPENPFEKPTHAREIRLELSSLRHEVSLLKKEKKERDTLLASLEKAVPVRHSVKVDGQEGLIGYVLIHPTRRNFTEEQPMET